MKKSIIPAGLKDTGQTIVLPLPVFDELLESDPGMRLQSPVVPVFKVVKWMDERICCCYARRGDRAGSLDCSQLLEAEGEMYCALNGQSQKSPCVFSESPDSEIWVKINHQIELSKNSGKSNDQ
jgi:hypothetical protein